jgi:hypothetical protein
VIRRPECLATLHVQVGINNAATPAPLRECMAALNVKLQSGDPILIEISAAASTPTQLYPTCPEADVRCR